MGMTASMKTTERKPKDQNTERLTRGLGWFSIGLGAAQVLTPSGMDRAVGVRDNSRNRSVMAGVGGARELAVGVGILSRRWPKSWLWARVAGDMLDLAMLGRAMFNDRNARRRVALAMMSVVGVTAADVLASVRQSRGSGPRTAIIRSAITIRRPIDEVYRFWRDFANLPRFMAHLESVQVRGDISAWRAKGPGGMTVEWDAELVADLENERIAWHSLADSDVSNAGIVRFSQAPGGRGTQVFVELEYSPPVGAAGFVVAKLLGEEPGQQVKDDLRRLKQVMETGDVVRSEGNPAGVLNRRQLAQRPAHPHDD
jgi:uncharacterized membrane protein